MPRKKMNELNNQTGSEIINVLAKSTSCTIPQVQEIFLALEKLVYTVIDSNYSDDISITLPYLGKIYFSKKKGKKAGSTYKVGGFSKGEELKIVTVEEDQPDYLRIEFKFNPKIQKETREKSVARSLKKKW